MDPAFYKRFTVSRGFEYGYYASPPSDGKPTLLFAHGFPSTSVNWSRQVAYFKPKGYGLIVPDMLGYGRTAKPADSAAYLMSLIATDLLELVEAEGANKVIAIGHDWGSLVVSRIATLYQDRFLGFGFLAVAYTPPNPNVTFDQMIAQFEHVIGYWSFFASPEAPAILEKHIDSFYDIVWAKDASLWLTHFCPTDAVQAWLKSGSRTDRIDSVSQEEYRQFQNEFLENGFEAPCNYYRTVTRGLSVADDKHIPADKYTITKPVLYLGGTKDPLAVAEQSNVTALCPNNTFKSLDTGHWIFYEATEEVNGELEKWIIRQS